MDIIESIALVCEKQDAIKKVDEWNKYNPLWKIPYPKNKMQIEDCVYVFDYYAEEMLEHNGREEYIPYKRYVKWSLSENK
jgi:hypothetical protein